MIYNMMNEIENEKNIIELLNDCNSVVVLSDNSFVLSSFVNSVASISAAKIGELNLYNGTKEVIFANKAKYNVIVDGVSDVDRLKIYFNDISKYKVYFLKANGSNIFEFNFTYVGMYTELDDSGLFGDGKVSIKENKVKQELVRALKSASVVFIQDINEDIVRIVQDYSNNVHRFKSVDSFFKFYEDESKSSTIALIDFEVPEDYSSKYFSSALYRIIKAGNYIVCNMSWVGAVMYVTSSNYELDLSSYFIYNSTKMNSLGNESIYEKSEDKDDQLVGGIV